MSTRAALAVGTMLLCLDKGAWAVTLVDPPPDPAPRESGIVGNGNARTLEGQTLTYSSPFSVVTPTTAQVGDGVEFVEDLLTHLPFFHFNIDFAPDGVLKVTWDHYGYLDHGGFDLQTYTLDSSSPVDFVSFRLLDAVGVSGVTQANLSFRRDAVTVQLGASGPGYSTFWAPGGFFTAKIGICKSPTRWR